MSETCFAASYYYYDDNHQIRIAMRQVWANSQEEAIGILMTKELNPPAEAKGILFIEFTEEMAKRVLGSDKDPLLSLAEDAISEN